MSGWPRAAGSALRGLAVCVAVLCVAALAAGPAGASIRRHHWQPTRHWQSARQPVSFTDPNKDAALVIDGETGKALYARNADALRHPASLTKMMTLYLLFEQLKSGQMTLATPLYVSAHAAIQAPTKLYLRAGSSIPVDTAIKAIVVLSANDVAVTIAEGIGGSESHFAEMMTAKARSWGMTHTFYHNASGLPDPLQITSAGDLAILARHLAYDFPQYFHYFSTYSFDYRGVTHFTHDNLIGRYEGADGIKTGYTGASGFNLVSSVVRNGVHIIGVVMGGITARRRDAEMVHLLDDTFAAIGKNPQLVARANVPWQAIAQNSGTKPVIAGFQFGTSSKSSATPNAAITAPLPGAPAAGTLSEDEDAAESRPDPDYDSVATASLRPSRTPIPSRSSGPENDIVTASLAPPAAQIVHMRKVESTVTALDANRIFIRGSVPVPQPKPSMMIASLEAPAAEFVLPKPREAVADHTAPSLPAAPSSGNPQSVDDWTIQIGAFDDAAAARAELTTYAQRSVDVLGQVARIVAPFQSAEGHVLYRARFGPFGERQARQVCQVLTQRGQTCFAAIASR
ncbi:MAG: serine hydrolase [Rhizomicrobium sp.]